MSLHSYALSRLPLSLFCSVLSRVRSTNAVPTLCLCARPQAVSAAGVELPADVGVSLTARVEHKRDPLDATSVRSTASD